MNTPKTLEKIASIVGGTVEGDPATVITGVASLDSARPGDLVFVDNARYLPKLAKADASAVILPEGMEAPSGLDVIRFNQPALGMARAVDFIVPRERVFLSVSPQAFLGERVDLAEDVGIGPGAYIGDGVKIGKGTEIHPAATIGHGSTIGENCTIYSGVHVYHETMIGDRVILHSGVVIGADGFGLVQEPAPAGEAAPDEPIRQRKVPQVGRVILEDDVEIGANSTIDRAALHTTRIGRGTKIDNLVMVAHNVQIGRHCMFAAQTGIAGSTRVGDYVVMAGQVGVVGHIQIGSRVLLGAQSGVTKSLPDGGAYTGTPVLPQQQALKAITIHSRLPKLNEELRQLKKRVKQLEGEG